MKKIVAFLCVSLFLIACSPTPQTGDNRRSEPAVLTDDASSSNSSIQQSSANETKQTFTMNGTYYSRHFNAEQMIGAIITDYSFEPWSEPMIKPSTAIVKSSRPGSYYSYTLDDQLEITAKAPAEWELVEKTTVPGESQPSRFVFTKPSAFSGQYDFLLLALLPNKEELTTTLLSEAVNANAKDFLESPKLSQYYYSYYGDYLYKYLRMTGTHVASNQTGYVFFATKETQYLAASVVGLTLDSPENFEQFEKEMIAILEDIHVEQKK